MSRTRATSPAVIAALVLLVAGAVPAGGQEFQWPDESENLEVLPDTIGADGLRRVMTTFTEALGVRCSHCHVGNGDLAEYDFASDEKEAKETTRVMMRMVQDINGTHLAELHEQHTHDDGSTHTHAGGHLEVRCVTCHRGATRPVLIQDLLANVVSEEGAEAAVNRYRELREEYYGGFTYDFRAGPLSELARRLASRGDTDAGLRMARLEVEYHPESHTAHFTLARLQQRAGMRQEAIASMERALEVAPEGARDFLRRQLERLRQQ
jgi:tetratricopeptide (TPR) repeat protein